MEQQLSDFWHWFIVIGTLASIVACAVILKLMTTKGLSKGEKAELHGNVWDEDLTEYNNPLPNWWKWLFYITIVFAILYLVFFPGLGNLAGTLGWSSQSQYQQEMAKANDDYGPIFTKYATVDIPSLSRDPKANEIGQRLFLNYCAQCHGSTAAGGNGFPNLADKDWLYGGDPESIKMSIAQGRQGVMPPLADAIGGSSGVNAVAQYVRALSGLQHEPILAAAGKEKFAICAACHGADGKGNHLMGAPNLTDNIWLYGASTEAIEEVITKGRSNAMPAQLERLGEAKVHLLTAYVYSLGGADTVAAGKSVVPEAPNVADSNTSSPVAHKKSANQ